MKTFKAQVKFYSKLAKQTYSLCLDSLCRDALCRDCDKVLDSPL